MPMQLKHNSHKIYVVETQADLLLCTQTIAPLSVIALDVEFDRNRFRYGFQLNLIQIASEKECFLIDPLKKLQLEPLWKVLRNAQQLKILHAANEDIQLLKSVGCPIQSVFDTEIAARLLNLPFNSLQGMLSTVLGITIEKGQQRSDWGKRPLTGQQLLYAVNDVSYLHKLYAKILELLQEKNLLWIFEQECVALTQKETESEEEKLKSLFNSCSEYEFFVITSIYHFREKIAQQLNKPPSQVFHNDVLWDLLKNPQGTLAAWLGLKGIHPYAKKEEFLEELETLINNAHALAQKKGLAKEKKFSGMTAEQRKALQDERDAVFMPIRNFLAQEYGEQGVTLILSKKLMDSLVSGNLKISQLKPYQQKLLVETAQKLEVNLEKYN